MATKHAKFLALAALLAGCGDIARDAAPPTDRFRFPVGLALRHLKAGCAAPPCACAAGSAGCQTVLHVVSSNFDLTYDTNEGGTLIAVRVPEPAERPAALGTGAIWNLPDILPYRLGAARIGTFGGEVALLDEERCPGWESGTAPGAPAAFVASRSRDRLYRLTLGGDGSLTCGDGCRVTLDPSLRDPYGMTLVCRGGPLAPEVSLYTTYLSTPSNVGYLSQLAVTPGATVLAQQIDVGVAPARSAQYEAATDRLYLTGRFVGPGYVPFRWLDLALGAAAAPLAVDLAPRIYGAETVGFAVSSDGTRAYVGLRLYDGYSAATLGVRTPDVGGALAVLDLTPALFGGPIGRLLALIPVGKGPSEVIALDRRTALAPSMADLVAVTCSDDGTVWLYDDARGTVPRIFSVDQATGTPVLGKQPAGLAVERRADGSARLYVGSFGTHFVSVIRIDDPADPGAAWIEMRLGMAQ